MAAMCVLSFNLSNVHFLNDSPEFSIIHYITLVNSRTDHIHTYVPSLLFSALLQTVLLSANKPSHKVCSRELVKGEILICLTRSTLDSAVVTDSPP